ncbi:MAG: four helix bundle protein [Cyclobacteriaceae bacterium]|nr:four helix bundle protein [Cyclobacteriaceae bacterium]
MKSYRELDIYNDSKRLAIEIHKMSLSLPKLEMYEEGSQVRRSSKAVASMIVEGYGRKRYKADFIKHLIYSQAECDETILHLDLLYETKSLMDPSLYQQLRNDYDVLSKRINKFIQWVESNWNDFDGSNLNN